MHIIFLGNITRPEDINKVGEVSIAGNKMITNLLLELIKYNDVEIDIVSSHTYKPFPKSKHLFVKKTNETMCGGAIRIFQTGYINVQFIRQICWPLSTYFMTKRLVRDDSLIFSFDMYPSVGMPMTWLSKKVNNKTLCLLADLSIGGIQNLHGLRKILRTVYDKRTLYDIKKCNNFIVLNEKAAKEYAPHAKFIVMDGGINPKEFCETGNKWDGNEKNIVYTGALVEYSGIMNLIKAVQILKEKNIKLDIYGDGYLKEDIILISKQFDNIRFHGRVSNDKALAAQQTSWLLVNPRPIDSHIAQVTFPSKIFEYLMSGRPVLTTRLNGFSSEYDKILFWADDTTPEGLAAEICNIMKNYTEKQLYEKAFLAKQFLLKNKTWEQNAAIVYNFIKNVFNE